jgi:Tol biopolymer transport system component
VQRLIIALVGLVVLSLSLSACGSNNDSQSAIVVETTAPPATPVPVPPTAQQLVVVRDGRLQVLTDSGQFVRELRDLTTSAGLSSAWVSSDGTNVYYAVAPGDVDTRRGVGLFRVPIAGGDSTQVGTGSLPTVSADGRTLAYVTVGSDNAPKLVLRELPSQRERTIAVASDASVDALAWSPVSGRLTVAYSFGAQLEQRAMVTVDPATATSLSQGVDVQRANAGSWRGSPAYRPDGTLFTLESCCQGALSTLRQSSMLVNVDPASGSVLRVVTPGEANQSIAMLGVSRDGVFVTWIVDDTLMRSESDGPATVVGDGFQAAAWTR